jgi:hypothetical protein
MAPPKMSFPECCEAARIQHLTCVHRMREHENQIPRIIIRKVPNRWQLRDLKRGVQVSHVTGELSDSRTAQDPMGQWRFSQLTVQIKDGENPEASRSSSSIECHGIRTSTSPQRGFANHFVYIQKSYVFRRPRHLKSWSHASLSVRYGSI